MKSRIHNFKLPIRNKRAFFWVQVFYGTAPIVAGYFVMQWIAPDQIALEEKLLAMEARDPERFAAGRAASEANRRELQEVRGKKRVAKCPNVAVQRACCYSMTTA